MTPERLREVRELFEATLEQDHTVRPAFLRAKCGDNQSLRKEVESLLQADSVSSRQLRSAIDASFEIVGDSAETPRRIGPYRVLRELGRGGLAAVYLAERADQPQAERVAIKVVRRGMDTEDLLRRLRQERRFLADLDHPNIARFLGGGTARDGRPYLVMEHIDGEPIDRYCDRHRLSIEARLELFRKVCAAVQAAHATSLIHRDIKPGNILVTADGTPKLLDFGIAKVLVPDHEMAALTQTATGLRLLTPAYASPEQIRGERLALHSDVYSLGVVLYQLLSGHRPYLFPNRSPTDIERIICKVEPLPPSIAVSKVERRRDSGQTETLLNPEAVSAARGLEPERLARRLRGDLDTIVAKAMHKDRSRRYASVQQLSEDLSRHLLGQPVMARQDSLGYRVGKFIKRHILGLAVAVGVSLLVTAVGGYQTYQAGNERGRSLLDADKKRALRKILDSTDLDLAGEEMPAVGVVLDNWAKMVETEEVPMLAKLLHFLGETYHSTRSYAEAEDKLQTAVELRLGLYGEKDLRVADSLNLLGEVQLHQAMIGERSQKLPQAAQNLRDALAIRMRSGADPRDILTSKNNVAALLIVEGDLEGSARLFQEVLDRRRQMLDPTDPELSAVLNNLGSALSRLGRYTEAEPLYQEALGIQERTYGRLHEATAAAIANLGSLYLRMGNTARAVADLEEALKIYRQLLGPEHPEVKRVAERLEVALEAPAGKNPVGGVKLPDW